MDNNIQKMLTVDDAKFLLDSGLNEKKILERFASEPPELQEQVRSIIMLNKAKSPTQKAYEHLHALVAEKLNSEFVIYRDELRTPVPLKRVKGNVIKESSLEGLLEVANKEINANKLILSKPKVKDLVETWEMGAQSIDALPPSFTTDPNQLTFNLVSLEVAPGPCPIFDDFISRCGANGPALMAFIWSIFEDVKLQQYMLMQGEGEDGKGSLMRLIEKIIGKRAYHGASSQDKYWPAKLVGKRVGFFGDVNSTAFVMSEAFKALTGGDKITIEEKHKASFSAYLDARIFIATNREPELTSQKADIRRIIYVYVEGPTEKFANYEENLELEASAILYKCREQFKLLYNPDNKKIKCDYTLAALKAEAFEVEFSGIVHQCFELGADYESVLEDVYNEVCQVFKYTSRFGQFTNWLAREHKVVEERRKVSGRTKPVRFLKGIKLKHKEIIK